jgi:hypothetical protein
MIRNGNRFQVGPHNILGDARYKAHPDELINRLS